MIAHCLDLFKFSMRNYPIVGSYLIYTFPNRQKAKDMDKGLMYFYFAPRIMLSKENYLYSFLTLAGTLLTQTHVIGKSLDWANDSYIGPIYGIRR